MKISFKQILVILTTLVTLTVNALANILPLNGLNTGQISDRFDVFFVPAGYVFSIWGLIYLALIAFTVYQALPSHKDDAVLSKVRTLYIIGSLANAVWIFLWHYLKFDFTLVAMIILLVSLLVIYTTLHAGTSQVTKGMKWFVRIPFSIYLGWITVATIANVTDVLAYHNWNGFGISGEIWAIIMLVVAVIIAALMTILNRDAAFLAVLIWAFAGIGVKFAGTSVVSTAAYITAAVVGILFLACLLIKPRAKLV